MKIEDTKQTITKVPLWMAEEFLLSNMKPKESKFGYFAVEMTTGGSYMGHKMKSKHIVLCTAKNKKWQAIYNTTLS